MEGEDVHHGRRSPARAIRGAELADEPRRRDRVAAGARPVDPARRQRTADHAHARRHRLQRVVGLGEQRQVGRARTRRSRRPRTAAARSGSGSARCRRSRRGSSDRRGRDRPRTRRTACDPRARAASSASRRGRPRRRHGRSESSAAAATFSRIRRSDALGASSPGFQIEVTRTARKPASWSSVICAFASTRLELRTTSSAAPSVSVGPPACAAGAEHERRQKCEKPPSHPRHGSVVL